MGTLGMYNMNVMFCTCGVLKTKDTWDDDDGTSFWVLQVCIYLYPRERAGDEWKTIIVVLEVNHVGERDK